MIKMTTLNILKILTEILKEYMHTSTFGLPPFCVTTFGRLTIFDTSEHPKASLIDLVKRRRITNLRILERGGYQTNYRLRKRLRKGRPLAIFDTSERPKTS